LELTARPVRTPGVDRSVRPITSHLAKDMAAAQHKVPRMLEPAANTREVAAVAPKQADLK
jgi:hypothetical protein